MLVIKKCDELVLHTNVHERTLNVEVLNNQVDGMIQPVPNIPTCPLTSVLSQPIAEVME